ncbi:uncharacterized protein LOC132546039 [Ylistrum balloti]|uniref:uncharacterized protein LOC132546039 n=1 Tax=Ylistrum balloti TaxID=509963 RepID=UPI002905B543|nr:uncharacterized protein LOC132546039 [Ylistrum balloti]
MNRRKKLKAGYKPAAVGASVDTEAVNSRLDKDWLSVLSLEILCLILDFLPLKDVMKMDHKSKKLNEAVSLHLRVRKKVDFTEEEVFGWMSDKVTDKILSNLLSRCRDLEYIQGLHVPYVAKRRTRGLDTLSVPGITEALALCKNLKGVEISDIFLLEAILAYLPEVEILGTFKNRIGNFPFDDVNKLKLSENPRITSLHLIGVCIPELPPLMFLKHLQLRWVHLSGPHPFMDFAAPQLQTFVMAHCGGPANSNPLKYVRMIASLATSQSLKRLELIRVPILGGLIQHVVEDSWRIEGFKKINHLKFGACKFILEMDVGYLVITAAPNMEELCLQPSLTKDSLFISLRLADVSFKFLQTLHLGFVDAFPEPGQWTNEDLAAEDLSDVVEHPAMVTDVGMKAVGQCFPELKHVQIYNCPHIHKPTAWLIAGAQTWLHLRELYLRRCHAIRLNDFCQFIEQLPNLELLHLEHMFREPPKGCSRVGLSAGTGLGMSSAFVGNQPGPNISNAVDESDDSDNDNNNNELVHQELDETLDDQGDFEHVPANQNSPIEPSEEQHSGLSNQTSKDDTCTLTSQQSEKPCNDHSQTTSKSEGCKSAHQTERSEGTVSIQTNTIEPSEAAEVLPPLGKTDKPVKEITSHEQSSSSQLLSGGSTDTDDVRSPFSSCSLPQDLSSSNQKSDASGISYDQIFVCKDDESCSQEQTIFNVSGDSRSTQLTCDNSYTENHIDEAMSRMKAEHEIELEENKLEVVDEDDAFLLHGEDMADDTWSDDDQSSDSHDSCINTEDNSKSTANADYDKPNSDVPALTDKHENLQNCLSEKECDISERNNINTTETILERTCLDSTGQHTDSVICPSVSHCQTYSKTQVQNHMDCKSEGQSESLHHNYIDSKGEGQVQTVKIDQRKSQCRNDGQGRHIDLVMDSVNKNCNITTGPYKETTNSILISDLKENKEITTNGEEPHSSQDNLVSDDSKRNIDIHEEKLDDRKNVDFDGLEEEEEEASSNEGELDEETVLIVRREEPRGYKVTSEKVNREEKVIQENNITLSGEITVRSHSGEINIDPTQGQMSGILSNVVIMLGMTMHRPKATGTRQLGRDIVVTVNGCSTYVGSGEIDVSVESGKKMISILQTDLPDGPCETLNDVLHSCGSPSILHFITEGDLRRISAEHKQANGDRRTEAAAEAHSSGVINQEDIGHQESNEDHLKTLSEALVDDKVERNLQDEGKEIEGDEEGLMFEDENTINSFHMEHHTDRTEDSNIKDISNRNNVSSTSQDYSSDITDISKAHGKDVISIPCEAANDNVSAQFDDVKSENSKKDNKCKDQSKKMVLGEGVTSTPDQAQSEDMNTSNSSIQDQEQKEEIRGKKSLGQEQTAGQDMISCDYPVRGVLHTCSGMVVLLSPCCQMYGNMRIRDAEVSPSIPTSAFGAFWSCTVDDPGPSSVVDPKLAVTKVDNSIQQSQDNDKACQTHTTASQSDPSNQVISCLSMGGPTTYNSGVSTISSPSRQVDSYVDGKRMIDKSTSTSDPVIEDDHIQVLEIKSKSLMCVSLNMVGITDLVLNDCPKLGRVTGCACRVLKKVKTESAPNLQKMSFAQCRKLDEGFLIEQITSMSAVKNRVVYLRPLHKFDRASLEKRLFGGSEVDYGLCVVYDYNPSAQDSMYNRTRVASWPNLFIGINLELLQSYNFRQRDCTISSKNPLDSSVYTMAGKNDNGSRWELITDIPWLGPLSDCADLSLSKLSAQDKKVGVYCPSAKGHFSVTECLVDLQNDIAEKQAAGIGLVAYSVIVYINMCDVSGVPVYDPYI